MALKFKIAKLEDVEEAQRALYVEDKEGGGFRLAVEGLDDPAELRRARDHEKTARQKAEKELREAREQQDARDAAAREAAEKAAKAAGDVTALEKSWQAKHDKAIADTEGRYKPEVESLTSDVNRLLVDNVAQSLAAKIGLKGSEQLLLPHIKARLKVDVRDGRRVTVVVDAEGKPSALTLEDLEKELVGNAVFAPVITGSKASGGGAGGDKKGGGAPGAKNLTRKDFDALDPAGRSKHMKDGGTVTD